MKFYSKIISLWQCLANVRKSLSFNTVSIGILVAVRGPDAYLLESEVQKLPFRDVLKKKYFENMQQIYTGAPIPKCDLNKVAKQIY